MTLEISKDGSSQRGRLWLVVTMCLVVGAISGCFEDEKREATEAAKEGVREFLAEEKEKNRPLKDRAWEGIGEGDSAPVEGVFGKKKQN